MKLNLTPEIIVALAQALLGVAAAFALPITQGQSEALIGLVTVVAAVLVGHSATSVNAASRVTAARARQPK